MKYYVYSLISFSVSLKKKLLDEIFFNLNFNITYRKDQEYFKNSKNMLKN